jgi:hypothetical protein
MKLQIKYDIGNNVYAIWGNKIAPAKVESIMVEAWEKNRQISYGLKFESGEYNNFDEGEIFDTKKAAADYLLREE